MRAAASLRGRPAAAPRLSRAPRRRSPGPGTRTGPALAQAALDRVPVGAQEPPLAGLVTGVQRHVGRIAAAPRHLGEVCRRSPRWSRGSGAGVYICSTMIGTGPDLSRVAGDLGEGVVQELDGCRVSRRDPAARPRRRRGCRSPAPPCTRARDAGHHLQPAVHDPPADPRDPGAPGRACGRWCSPCRSWRPSRRAPPRPRAPLRSTPRGTPPRSRRGRPRCRRSPRRSVMPEVADDARPFVGLRPPSWWRTSCPSSDRSSGTASRRSPCAAQRERSLRYFPNASSHGARDFGS